MPHRPVQHYVQPRTRRPTRDHTRFPNHEEKDSNSSPKRLHGTRLEVQIKLAKNPENMSKAVSVTRPRVGGLGRPSLRGLRARGQRHNVQVKAFFDLFNGKKSQSRSSGRRDELIEELLRATANTNGGLGVGVSVREEISDLVDELQNYCMKDPLGSENIFGRWEVRYASKPGTAGGPFRTPVGRLVFPGQRAIQIIEEPNVCINQIEFKTLGFIPGSVTQEGTVEPVDGRTFEITFTTNTGKNLGGPPKRLIEILYLDESIRIARAVPLEDNKEPGFYVFTREGTEYQVEEEEVNAVESSVGASKAEQAAMERQTLAAARLEAKELYAELTSKVKELTLDAQGTASQLSSVEKEAAGAIREAATARRLIEKSENIVGTLEARLFEAQEKEVILEKEILSLQRESNRIRQQLISTKKSLGPAIK